MGGMATVKEGQILRANELEEEEDAPPTFRAEVVRPKHSGVVRGAAPRAPRPSSQANAAARGSNRPAQRSDPPFAKKPASPSSGRLKRPSGTAPAAVGPRPTAVRSPMPQRTSGASPRASGSIARPSAEQRRVSIQFESVDSDASKDWRRDDD
jgi:hypothetical protein